MTEFQAAILLSQMTRLEAQIPHSRRECPVLDQAAAGHPWHHPGQDVRRVYAQCLSFVHASLWQGTFCRRPRKHFLKALTAEGIPCAAGYTPLNKQPFLAENLNSRVFKRSTRGTGCRRTRRTIIVPRTTGCAMKRRCGCSRPCSWATGPTWTKLPPPSARSTIARGIWLNCRESSRHASA